VNRKISIGLAICLASVCAVGYIAWNWIFTQFLKEEDLTDYKVAQLVLAREVTASGSFKDVRGSGKTRTWPVVSYQVAFSSIGQCTLPDAKVYDDRLAHYDHYKDKLQETLGELLRAFPDEKGSILGATKRQIIWSSVEGGSNKSLFFNPATQRYYLSVNELRAEGLQL
jgi:hypothetical protein